MAAADLTDSDIGAVIAVLYQQAAPVLADLGAAKAVRKVAEHRAG